MGEDFRERLRRYQSADLDMEAAVGRLPADVRERLAAGPLAARYACGVCEAFTPRWIRDADLGDFSDPMVVVFLYHEVPKIHMKVARDQWSGPHAEEVHRRCLDTYRAAGWTREAVA